MHHTTRPIFAVLSAQCFGTVCGTVPQAYLNPLLSAEDKLLGPPRAPIPSKAVRLFPEGVVAPVKPPIQQRAHRVSVLVVCRPSPLSRGH